MEVEMDIGLALNVLTPEYLVINDVDGETLNSRNEEYQISRKNDEGLKGGSPGTCIPLNCSSSSHGSTYTSDEETAQARRHAKQTNGRRPELTIPKKYGNCSPEELLEKRRACNVLERTRMRKLNSALLQLRKCLPRECFPPHKKVSKIKTLRSAAEYIKVLSEMLKEPQNAPAPEAETRCNQIFDNQGRAYTELSNEFFSSPNGFNNCVPQASTPINYSAPLTYYPDQVWVPGSSLYFNSSEDYSKNQYWCSPTVQDDVSNHSYYNIDTFRNDFVYRHTTYRNRYSPY